MSAPDWHRVAVAWRRVALCHESVIAAYKLLDKAHALHLKANESDPGSLEREDELLKELQGKHRRRPVGFGR